MLLLPSSLVATAVPTVRLNNGVLMPAMAMGTGGFDNVTASVAVAEAIAGGLRHIHTAFDYFNLQGVARGIARSGVDRADLFVSGMTSPCVHPAAPPVRNVTDPAACEALTEAEARGVITQLGLKQLDLLMLHGPSAAFGSTGPCDAGVCALNAAQWRAYARLLADGAVRAIGVSNFCQSCFECLLADATVPRPAVNQIQLHVGMGADPEGLLSYCAAAGVVVQAYSPLASGEVVSDPLCTETGAALNRSAAAVGLRWVLQNAALRANGSAPTLVTKATTPAYVAEDVLAFEWELPTAAMAALDGAVVPKGQQDGRPSWGCAER